MSKARNLAGFAGSISSNNDLNVGIITATSFSGTDVNVSGVVTATSFSGTDVNVSGVVTATSFVGDGSGLTGVGIGTDGSVNTVGIITASSFSGDVVIGAGSTSAPSLAPTGDSNTGVFFPSADTIALSSGGSERLRVDSSGNINIDSGGVYYDAANNRLAVGTTSPTWMHEVNKDTSAASIGLYPAYSVNNPNAAGYSAYYLFSGTTNKGGLEYNNSADLLKLGAASQIVFATNGIDTERARIDSSGRLLIGTSSTSSTATLLLQGYSGTTGPGVLRCCTTTNGPSSTEDLGYIMFGDATHVNAAWIQAQRDGGTWTAGSSYPGRLVFSTTADGASSPTERMRIGSAGNVRFPDVYNATIASSANVFIDTDGTLKRATSSIKYKTNVETLEDQYADAVLSCRPVWYQSTSSGDNPEWGYWGFIAEEVAEIDPRLVQWKLVEQVINEDGSRDTVPLETPEPENVAYDRFVPHLLNLIKRQKEQIEAMEARLSALETP